MAKRAKQPAGQRPKAAAPAAAVPDLDRATLLVMELMAIPGPSGQEQQVVDYVVDQLLRAGAPSSAIKTDQAHRRTPIDGQVGNLIFRMPGTHRGPRRMLMAHLDTVPICVGARPIRQGNVVRSKDPNTGLGADDRAGVAVILNTAIELQRRQLPHPPLTFFWPVQEEVGLQGARLASLGLLGKPRLAFNFDGGSPAKLTIGATGGYRMTIRVEGIASHAGGAPEQGVSAVAIAGLAITDLQKNGWHGAIRKGRQQGTSNVGIIRGGQATNVVAELVELRAEARSHDAQFRKRIVREIETAFQRAAKSVKNVMGTCGRVTFDGSLDYESFKLSATEPCVGVAERTVESIGIRPIRFVCDGGLDANWMTARGIPTVTLGCGQLFQHTCKEQLDVSLFHDACRIALLLATGIPRGHHGSVLPATT